MSSVSFVGDPFPDIPPALLNSADLHAYAAAPGTKLFDPFDPGLLKSASYEVRFAGATYYQWRADNAPREDRTLGPRERLVIEPNSIVFISPAVKFSVPPFLALRFNLAIRWVHRGLLLGTGPLVDPGFEGKLLIPVHNLTNKVVEIDADEGFIWVEVTKVSPHPPLNKIHQFSYVPFRDDKKNVEAFRYFEKANKGAAIQSSVRDIANLVQRMKRWFKRVEVAAWVGGMVSALAIGAAFYGIIVAIAQLSEATKQSGESTKQLVLSTHQMISDAKDQNSEVIRKLEQRIDELERQAEAAKQVATPSKPKSRQ